MPLPMLARGERPVVHLKVNAYKLSLDLSDFDPHIRARIRDLVDEVGRGEREQCKLLRHDLGEVSCILRVHNLTLTIYRNSFLNVSGCKDINKAARVIANFLRTSDVVGLRKRVKVDNIHTSGRLENVKDLIDLQSVADCLLREQERVVSYVRYAPDIFPSLFARTSQFGSFQLFASGSIVVLGIKDLAKLNACRRWLQSFFHRCQRQGKLHFNGQ